MVACADVHLGHAHGFAEQFGGKCQVYQDYRKVLDRKDVQAVTIGTPDHWHVKIAIDAMKAGKDVYCEKPLTLTIDEGRLICKAVKETGRVFQVGTQQRSEYDARLSRRRWPSPAAAGWASKLTARVVDRPGPVAAVRSPPTSRPRNWIGTSGWARPRRCRYCRERASAATSAGGSITPAAS